MAARRSHLHSSTLRPLAACLALALGAQAFATEALGDRIAVVPPDGVGAKRSSHPTVSQTRTVANCSDNSPDSLRDIITNPNNPNHAQTGDIVDLSQLPILCGVADSTITLSSGEIAIGQNDLTLLGPARDQGRVTISGAGAHRVFEHTGAGTLGLTNLTIADGYHHAASNAYGGCIWSNAPGTESVYLSSTIVMGCTALSDAGYAAGGAIDSKNLVLVGSTVSDSQALSPTKRGFGGGIRASYLFAVESSISGNVAGDGPTSGGVGGGAYILGSISMLRATVDHNTASYGGGLVFRSATTLVNSTISTNTAHRFMAALFDRGSDSLTISNSTIAFNHAETTSPYGAVYFQGQSASSTVDLSSSIIADNTAGATNTPSDLSLAQGILSGADNLVIATNVIPLPGVITVIDDPKLGPLQFNGGVTRTHALLPGSPAVGAGNHNAIPGITNDQRGSGYPRTTGSGANETTDIGALEFDTIFVASFDL